MFIKVVFKQIHINDFILRRFSRKLRSIFYKDKKQTFLTTYIDFQDAATKVNLRTRRRHSEIIFK